MDKAKTEIVVTERFKVVHVDSLNWQVFEYKQLKAPKNPSIPSREGEHDWVPLQKFFGQLSPALRWIAEQQVNNGEKMTLQEAVSMIETSNLKLLRDIEKALKAANL